MNQAESFLAFLKAMQPDFEVARLNPETKKPSEWKKLSEINYPLSEISTRVQLENELILELDKPTRMENLAFAAQIAEILKANGYGFFIFYGGTKSMHINVFFETKITNKEREAFIDYYLIDFKAFLDKSYWTKKSQMIALEYAPHFKTGNIKELYLAEQPQINKLQAIKVTKCGVINYALTHRLPEGERNSIIMPNFIALCPPKEIIEKMAESQQMPYADIIGWKKTKFFCGQLKQYWKKLNLPDLCAACNKKNLKQYGERPNHNDLANEIMEKYKIVTFSDTDEIYAYSPESGLYEESQHLIEFEIQELVKDETTTNYVNEVLNSIKRKTRIERDIVTAETNLIPLQNGIFDTITKTLKEYGQEHIFLSRHNVVYNPDAVCPKIEKFLTEIAKDENDKQLLKELAGYCFFRHYNFQCVFLLIGTGANGKSVYLNLLINMLGENNVSQKPLQMLTNYFFSISSLFSKNANIFADLPKKAFNDTGMLKALSGGDWIDAEIKHKGSIKFKNYAKLIASCNELPETPDDSDGFFRRTVTLSFPNKFENEKENNKLLEELSTESEKSGFLNVVISAFMQAEANKRLTYLPNTAEKRKIYLNFSNSVKVFCEERIEMDSNSEIEKVELYENYQKYCETHKIPLKPIVWFFREFYKFFGGNARQSRKDGVMKVLGVGWREAI